MPKSKKQIARQVTLRTFHRVEQFIPVDKVWEAFAAVFWTCPLCGSKVNKDGCEGKNCWNHPVGPDDHSGKVKGDYPILGIECPRHEFEASEAPLCHTCKKQLAKRDVGDGK